MATDELRQLPERYPAIDGAETRRMRRLLGEASATDTIAINQLVRTAGSQGEAADASRLEVVAIVVGIALVRGPLYLLLGGAS